MHIIFEAVLLGNMKNLHTAILLQKSLYNCFYVKITILAVLQPKIGRYLLSKLRYLLLTPHPLCPCGIYAEIIYYKFYLESRCEVFVT